MKADLVVIGHSRKGILARWLQGSIGEKLLIDLPCSLLIAAIPWAELFARHPGNSSAMLAP